MELRDLILNATDLKREAVTVPEWNGVTVFVGTMNGRDRTDWSAIAFDSAGKLAGDYHGKLLVYCLQDEAGSRIFTPADAEALEKKNSDVLYRLFTIARRLNGLGVEQVDAAEKN